MLQSWKQRSNIFLKLLFVLLHQNVCCDRSVLFAFIILLHSEGPKLHRVMAVLSAIGLKVISVKILF